MQEVRVDSAHSPSSLASLDEQPLEQIMRAVAGQDEDQVAAQVQRQTAEISAHLQRRQAELDDREAELNAQLAQMEHDARKARLLMREGSQTEKFSEAMQDDQGFVSERGTANHQAFEPRGRWRAWLDARHCAENRERPATIPTETAQHAVEDRLPCDRPIEEPATIPSHSDPPSDPDSGFQQRFEAEWSEKHAAIERRKEELLAEHSSVESLYAQASEMYHESLKMRMVSEELWQVVTNRVPTAEAMQMLHQLRSRLNDHLRLQCEDLERRRQELDRTANDLNEQKQQLWKERCAVQEWVAARYRDLERETARLVSRERALYGQAKERLA